LKIYNTLSHKKQLFKSIADGSVGMYTCGPTVYSYAHIGNMRAYIAADVLKRLFLANGYKVKHVMNITDVGHLVSDANLGEDKVRMAAEHEHRSVHDVVKFYTEEFLKDMNRLNIIMPTILSKATDHITEMISLIEKLDKKGYTYKISTGIYFDTSKFKNYGQLMGMKFKDLNKYLISGARVERASGTKNVTDFAVWRFSTPEMKEMVWDTKYGRGFPGWHIECSAMSMKYLGEHFDIHTGGIDHLPIHHTNEIAQSESATGKKFVNYWFHNEFLQINGQKFSKSLKNTYTLQELLDKGYSAQAFRYLMLSAHYKTQLNFTFDALEGAGNTVQGIYKFIKKLADVPHEKKPSKINKRFISKVYKIREKFFEKLNDDVNTPLALAQMHKLVSETNKTCEKGISKDDANLVLEIMLEFDKVLGLGFEDHMAKKKLPDYVGKLIKEREALRKAKKFEEADKIRNRLKKDFGIEIEDTGSGTAWN
jgi:cysteinyl-tRNA synthetase